MKLYKARGNGTFDVVECENNAPQEYVRLKMSMISPNRADVSVYEGRLDLSYPRVPCGFATAMASEDCEEYDLKRGEKVIINPYVLSGMDQKGYLRTPIYGIDEDGFLRDFVALPIDNIVPFPEGVKEHEALLAPKIAIALSVLKALHLHKGDYVAVIGNSSLSNLIAQLALYYQAIPILVASDSRYLELAEKTGIYYRINEFQENPTDRVRAITGGRMAEHTILHAKGGETNQFLFSLAMQNGNAMITGVTPYVSKVDVDMSQIAQKNLTVRGITCGADEFSSAVNILAQHVLKLDDFVDKVVMLDETESLFSELCDSFDNYICPVIKVP